MSKRQRSPQTDKFSHEIATIHPRNPRQKAALESLDRNTLTILTGPPGTAKTLLSVYYAVRLYKSRAIEKIYYTKPIVPSEGDGGLGFLKGDINEKVLPHIAPVKDALQEILGEGHANSLIDQQKIEFLPFEHLRGRSLNDAFIIADEMQNACPQATYAALTRLGRNTKLALCGDLVQRDLSYKFGRSGLEDVLDKLTTMAEVGHVHFDVEDITRSPFVREIVKRYRADYVSAYRQQK